MVLDIAIILAYFAVILLIGVFSRSKKEVSSDEYFLSSRSLRWPSIAISTIATNISAGHFIAMAGSAYVFGLAQANLEVNAIFGIVLAVFFFVPLYLRLKITTISQFFEAKFGPKVALAYSGSMIVLYGLLYLGTSLFWGAYAIDGIFGDFTAFISEHRAMRLCVLILALGVFSAFYTYLGGLTAVVRTDIAQFILLSVGGLILVGTAVYKLGGWSNLWDLTAGLGPAGDHLMHIHLPASDDKLPWTAIIGMCLLNLSYWGANQVILQRALAAKSLRHAQIGLLVGGVFKYFMVLIIIIPGIALAGILRDNPLQDPDQAYIVLAGWLPSGVRGLILCGFFASLMSTVDSIFNSVSTLWSIDVYKRHLKKDASDAQVVSMGKKTILATLVVGALFAFLVVRLKTGAHQDDPLTHWFNEASYYLKNGSVLLIVAAVFVKNPSKKLVLLSLVLSVPLYYFTSTLFPDVNYFVRSAVVVVATVAVVAVPAAVRGRGIALPGKLITSSSRSVAWFGAALMASLVLVHLMFH